MSMLGRESPSRLSSRDHVCANFSAVQSRLSNCDINGVCPACLRHIDISQGTRRAKLRHNTMYDMMFFQATVLNKSADAMTSRCYSCKMPVLEAESAQKVVQTLSIQSINSGLRSSRMATSAKNCEVPGVQSAQPRSIQKPWPKPRYACLV